MKESLFKKDPYRNPKQNVFNIITTECRDFETKKNSSKPHFDVITIFLYSNDNDLYNHPKNKFQKYLHKLIKNKLILYIYNLGNTSKKIYYTNSYLSIYKKKCEIYFIYMFSFIANVIVTTFIDIKIFKDIIIRRISLTQK